MARPRDWGDPIPGDADDTAPGDPTAGYSEIDYAVGGENFNPLKQPLRGPSPFVPDSGVEPVNELTRTDFAGIVLAWANPKDKYPRFYWILRQDGGLGLARTLDDSEYADFRPGDHVGIVEDNVENEFIIISTPRPDELSSIDAAYTNPDQLGELEDTAAFQVKFDTVVEKFPIDNSWGHFNEITLENDGSIKVHEDGVYDIWFNVTVEHTEPEVGMIPTKIESSCELFDADTADIEDVTDEVNAFQLAFDRSVGFRIKRDTTDCSYHITFENPVPDSMLNVYNTYNNQRPVWTSAPRIGHSLAIGTNEPDAWLKIGSDYGHAWIGRGRQSKKMMFRMPPDKPETSCDFLVVDAYTEPQTQLYQDDAGDTQVGQAGHLVELTWRRPGGTGTLKSMILLGYESFEVEGYGYQIPLLGEVEYEVVNGLVMSGYCIEDTVCNKSGRHYDSRDKAYNPCDTQYRPAGDITLRGQFQMLRGTTPIDPNANP